MPTEQSKPTLEEVRSFVVRLLALPGWIGEGDEIARDIRDFIDAAPPRLIGDGRSMTVTQIWQETFDEHGIT